MSNKGNEHKKATWIDRFARKYFCTHARLNQLRSDKRVARRKYRRDNRKACRQETQNEEENEEPTVSVTGSGATGCLYRQE